MAPGFPHWFIPGGIPLLPEGSGVRHLILILAVITVAFVLTAGCSTTAPQASGRVINQSGTFLVLDYHAEQNTTYRQYVVSGIVQNNDNRSRVLDTEVMFYDMNGNFMAKMNNLTPDLPPGGTESFGVMGPYYGHPPANKGITYTIEVHGT
jgi:hypothetical protein